MLPVNSTGAPTTDASFSHVSGKLTLEGPVLGGMHKVYDIFYASLDTAYKNNRLWWKRITFDLGGRFPQWFDDSTIYFTRDVNANYANSEQPNYQICSIDPEGDNEVILRKDWQSMFEQHFMNPVVSKDGKLALSHFYSMKIQGFSIIDLDDIMIEPDSLKPMTVKNANLVAQNWSPDGKWLVYVKNKLNDNGIYVCDPNMSRHYEVFTPPVGTYVNTVPPSFSPNSKWLTFSTTDGSIWICDITGNGSRRLSGPGMDSNPAWSK